jgi:hypothetical protein
MDGFVPFGSMLSVVTESAGRPSQIAPRLSSPVILEQATQASLGDCFLTHPPDGVVASSDFVLLGCFSAVSVPCLGKQGGLVLGARSLECSPSYKLLVGAKGGFNIRRLGENKYLLDGLDGGDDGCCFVSPGWDGWGW